MNDPNSSIFSRYNIFNIAVSEMLFSGKKEKLVQMGPVISNFLISKESSSTGIPQVHHGLVIESMFSVLKMGKSNTNMILGVNIDC